ncbi:hypothetical protein FB639_001947 [Coemansia asiatica]|nr:hypothetical protein FB639_001947 [Coemansia asiatica]
MENSDSDSDDFFSDIRTLRRKLGLSTKATAQETDNTTTTTTPTLALALALAPAKAKTKAKLGSAPLSAAVPPSKSSPRHLYHQGSAQHTSDPTHRAAAEPAARDARNRVTPQEIAALLSPRKQRSKKSRRLSSEQQNATQSPKRTIPARTPESRIASPHTPTTNMGSAKRRASVDVASPTGSSFGSQPLFSVRSLWDGTDLSPLRTPARRLLGSSPSRTTLAGGLPADTNMPSIGESYAGMAEETGLLGSVEDALITEKDLDHAQRKLGEAEALTQQQILRELRERIRAFSDSAIPGTSDIFNWWPSITLLCQFHTLGHGQLGYCQSGVLWRGSFVGAIATAVQNQTGGLSEEQCRIEDNLVLVFPWHRVSCLRSKSFDSMDHIMMTVDEDMGVAFQVGGDCSIEVIQKRVASMNVCLSDAMKLRRQQHPLDENSDSDKDDTGLAVSEQQTRLVESILRYAVSTRTELLHDLDISQALQHSSFMKPALELISQFAQQLAAMAVETKNKKRKRRRVTADITDAVIDDDPGTETIPGTCTLCYAAEEAVILHPCEHRVCSSCFAHLKTMPPTASQTPMRIFQGTLVNYPLNEVGKLQASALAEDLKEKKIDWIITSQFDRAIETGRHVSMHHPQATITTDERLQEISWGIADGKYIDEIAYIVDPVIEKWYAGDFDACVDEGESPNDCKERTIAAFADILAKAHENKYKRVFVNTHGRTLRIIMSLLMDKNLRNMKKYGHTNCSYHVVSVEIDDQEDMLTPLDPMKLLFKLERHDVRDHLKPI